VNAPVEIRPAQEEDLPLIHEFIRELAIFEKLERDFSATIGGLRESLFGTVSRARVLLAFRGGEPAGYAVYLFTYSTFAAKPLLYLEDLFVRPAHRGAGVGRSLIAELARVARENKCARIELSVLDWNTSAIEFYERLGATAQKAWVKYSLPVNSTPR
jgi:ribosomal protein S18 acetylase RimI-like enzyme